MKTDLIFCEFCNKGYYDEDFFVLYWIDINGYEKAHNTCKTCDGDFIAECSALGLNWYTYYHEWIPRKIKQNRK